jgi:hypothetical protein
MADSQATQTCEEICGLLTAISIVSKRLAENLKKTAEKEDAVNGQQTRPSG